MEPQPPFWQRLFTSESATVTSAARMKLLKKRGQPFLLLPSRSDLAARGLDLYPAQTRRSRLARSLARWLLITRLPLGTRSVQVHLSPDDPFVGWLRSLAQIPSHQLPQFAILAGNPNSPGQRLIILLFNTAGKPTAVIKAGLSQTARELIRQEQRFLKEAPQTFPFISVLRATFENKHLDALALDYLPGHSPTAKDERLLPQVLTRWLHPQQQVTFTNTRVGRELASSDNPVFKAWVRRMQTSTFRAAIYHGDFTPWNARVSDDGQWTVLDWERGEVSGLPAWDWFHYVVQKEILVRRQSADSVAASLEALLEQAEFKTYAQASGVAGTERSLLLLYLLHCTEVIRPSEGLRVMQDLRRLFENRWAES